MAHSTLADALHRKAEEDVEAVWQKARADADGHRADRARAVEEQRTRAAQALAEKASGFARDATAAAEGKARTMSAASKGALADRLYRLAIDALPHFRRERYEELFAALVRELPSRPWQRVTVNPADQGLALRHFPQAQIVCDAAIVGGMDVAAEDGRVRVSNTLETRLAIAWPEILPGLMADVLEELSHS